MGACAILGNIAIVVVFLFNRNTQVGKVHYLLVTQLAIADLLMGIYLVILAIQDISYGQSYQTLSRTWQSSLTCRTAGFLAFLSSQASLGFLLMVGVDRFTALFRPFEHLRLTVYSTKVSVTFTWFLTGVLGIAFAALAGPADNDKFGQSDVCFSLPYMIKPIAFAVDVGSPARIPYLLYLPAKIPKTAAWSFLSSILYGLDLIGILTMTSLAIGIAIFGLKSYRNYQNMEQIKLTIRVAPFILLKISTWLLIIAVGVWSTGAGNVVSTTFHSWFMTLVFPLSSCLGPVLYTSLVYFTLLEPKDDGGEDPIVDTFTTIEQQNVVAEMRENEDVMMKENEIELKAQEVTEGVQNGTGIVDGDHFPGVENGIGIGVTHISVVGDGNSHQNRAFQADLNSKNDQDVSEDVHYRIGMDGSQVPDVPLQDANSHHNLAYEPKEDINSTNHVWAHSDGHWELPDIEEEAYDGGDVEIYGRAHTDLVKDPQLYNVHQEAIYAQIRK